MAKHQLRRQMRQRFTVSRFTRKAKSHNITNITPMFPTWTSSNLFGESAGARKASADYARSQWYGLTEAEVRKLYEEDLAFFVFNGTTPDLKLMQEQHLSLARTYEKLGVKVHYSSWSEEIPDPLTGQ